MTTAARRGAGPLTRVARGFLVASLAASLAAQALAGDPPKDAEGRKRLESLKSRAKEWLQVREGTVYKCPTCQGDGRVEVRVNMSVVTRACAKCSATGARFDRAKANKAYFDFQSPSWRAAPGNAEAAQARIDAFEKDKKSALLKKWKIEDATLVDETHGTIQVHENADVAPKEYRWVFADDAKTKTRGPTWYLFDAAADGPWPETRAPVPVDVAVPKIEALDEETAASLKRRLALARVRHALEVAQKDGDAVVLRLRLAGASSEEALEKAVSDDAVPAARTTFAVVESAKSVRLVVLARYRDKLGSVSVAPHATLSIDRETWGKIVFDNLTNDEVVALFKRERHDHSAEGLILWWKE